MTNTHLAIFLLLLVAVPVLIRGARELERQKRYRWLMRRYTDILLTGPVHSPRPPPPAQY